MPKIPIDYSNTVIYKLVCKDVNITEIYVGHTTNLVKRKYCHKYDCYNPNRKNHNSNLYTFIRDNGGFEYWDSIVIEQYPCNNVMEACERERYWIEKLNASLNMCIPVRTYSERQKYRETYRIEHKDAQKVYRINNKDAIQRYHQERYQNKKITATREIFLCLWWLL